MDMKTKINFFSNNKLKFQPRTYNIELFERFRFNNMGIDLYFIWIGRKINLHVT